MNIKLYSSVWAGNRRIYGLSDLTLTGPIYSLDWLITDEYTCPIFIGDVAESTNIGDTGYTVRVHLYSSVTSIQFPFTLAHHATNTFLPMLRACPRPRPHCRCLPHRRHYRARAACLPAAAPRLWRPHRSVVCCQPRNLFLFLINVF
jgi:hypothetical protein